MDAVSCCLPLVSLVHINECRVRVQQPKQKAFIKGLDVTGCVRDQEWVDGWMGRRVDGLGWLNQINDSKILFLLPPTLPPRD